MTGRNCILQLIFTFTYLVSVNKRFDNVFFAYKIGFIFKFGMSRFYNLQFNLHFKRKITSLLKIKTYKKYQLQYYMQCCNKFLANFLMYILTL